MSDQAAKLRNLMQNINAKKEKENKARNTETENSAYVYTVTSGKGGVGKSNFTANLALALQKLGKRVVVFDADLGMANLDVILGVTPSYNLEHVIKGVVELDETIVEGPGGINLIPGGSGIQELANLSQYQINNLLSGFVKIGDYYDIILVDTGAGLANNVIDFVLGADEVIIISTPEPTSITDAYGVIKVIAKRNSEAKIKFVVNQAPNSKMGQSVANRVIKTARQFLEVDINLLNVLPKDEVVVKSVMKRRPFILEFPKSAVAKSVEETAAKLIDKELPPRKKGIKGIFKKMFGF